MRRALFLMAGCVAAGLFGLPARATTIFSIQPTGIPGSSGAFDVVLTNTGPSSISVAGFNFEVSVSTPNITLTGANISTVFIYIFAGNSFDQNNGFTLNTTSGQTLDGSDTTDNGLGITVGSGGSFGLGHVLFTVSGGATPGIYPVSFTGGINANNLSDANGSSVPVNSFVGGNITVTGGSPTPEPATGALVGLALALAVGMRLRRRF